MCSVVYQYFMQLQCLVTQAHPSYNFRFRRIAEILIFKNVFKVNIANPYPFFVHDLWSGYMTMGVLPNAPGHSVCDMIRTLFCPVCQRVFLPPVKTCVNGHVTCFYCLSAPRKCGVCRGRIMVERNLLVEKQLEMLSAGCGSCGTVVQGSRIYHHYAICEFR